MVQEVGSSILLTRPKIYARGLPRVYIMGIGSRNLRERVCQLEAVGGFDMGAKRVEAGGEIFVAAVDAINVA